MSRTKPTTEKRRENGPPVKTGRPTSATTAEVLTLTEAATFLRLTEDEVIRLVNQQNLPGRSMGPDWRFLKSALQDWLRTPPLRGSKEAVLSAAGSWKDDPLLEEELQEIYKRRGRPMTENGK